MDFKQTYSFDDVLLVPKYSQIESRSQIDISNTLSPNIKLSLPVISSPMDTVTEDSMAMTIGNAGGLGVIHRYNSIDEQASLVKNSFPSRSHVAAAVGATGDFLERIHWSQRYLY